MAKSFWSKRTSTPTIAGDYQRPTGGVSGPMSIALIVVGILIIGGLLFGVFQGARWAFNQLSDDDTIATVPTSQGPTTDTTSTTDSSNTQITATSSTTTTTPSATTATTPVVSTTTVPATNTQALPQTGPASNTIVFLAVLVISYLSFRKLSLKSQ